LHDGEAVHHDDRDDQDRHGDGRGRLIAHDGAAGQFGDDGAEDHHPRGHPARERLRQQRRRPRRLIVLGQPPQAGQLSTGHVWRSSAGVWYRAFAQERTPPNIQWRGAGGRGFLGGCTSSSST
jgi:hypothetical protein